MEIEDSSHKLNQASTTPPQWGTLYGISVGPGDPELMTVKGMRCFQQVRVVAFPQGIGDRPGIAQSIASQWITADHIQLSLTFPYTQDEVELELAWKMAAEQIAPYLSQGQDVGFICEGDISFYSTFTYLAQTLQQLYPKAMVEAIPGVCSPMAAATALGLPLTVRSQRLAILPALYSMDNLETALNTADVVVLMKMSSVYDQIWTVLQRYDRLKASYVVEWVTHPHQKIYRDLSDRPHLSLSYFSIMVIQR